jgi:molybdate transport system substrate-binding protein
VSSAGHRFDTGRRRRASSLVLLLVVIVAACTSGTDGGASEGTEADTTAAVSGEIVVSAAASLTDVFTDLADEFLRDHPAADITFNFGSSGSLAAQLRDGAPADVAAFADTAPMDELERAGLLATTPRVFARNELVLVTQSGSPDGIDEVDDLVSAGVVSLCVDTAPCGRFADEILATAGVEIPETSVSRGTDARATLRAVTEGDAVAAIVYATDALSAADQVDTSPLPGDDHPVARYPIAVVAGTSDAELAEAFTAYVLSDAGRAVLEDAGFRAP